MHRVVAPPGAVAKDGLLPSRYSIPYVSFPLDLDIVTRLISSNILSSVHPYVFPLSSPSTTPRLISWGATGHVDDHRRDTRHVVGRSAQEV
jgi:hypothetical protein